MIEYYTTTLTLLQYQYHHSYPSFLHHNYNTDIYQPPSPYAYSLGCRNYTHLYNLKTLPPYTPPPPTNLQVPAELTGSPIFIMMLTKNAHHLEVDVGPTTYSLLYTHYPPLHTLPNPLHHYPH